MPNYRFLTSITPSIYLMMLPYKYKESLFILITFFLLNRRKRVLYCKMRKGLQSIRVLHMFLVLTFIYFDNPDNKILTQYIICPYFLLFRYTKNGLYKLNIYYLTFKISNYLIKSIMINAIHLVITSNLFLFTRNEILLSNLNALDQKFNINNNKKHNSKQLSLNILSSYEILEVVLNKFYYIYIGIRCKNSASFKSYVSYLHYFLNNIFSCITVEIYLSIINLWTRY